MNEKCVMTLGDGYLIDDAPHPHSLANLNVVAQGSQEAMEAALRLLQQKSVVTPKGLPRARFPAKADYADPNGPDVTTEYGWLLVDGIGVAKIGEVFTESDAQAVYEYFRKAEFPKSRPLAEIRYGGLGGAYLLVKGVVVVRESDIYRDIHTGEPADWTLASLKDVCEKINSSR
jgi:hypothetical protein